MVTTVQIKLDEEKPFDKKILDHKKKNHPHLTLKGYFLELARKDSEGKGE